MPPAGFQGLAPGRLRLVLHPPPASNGTPVPFSSSRGRSNALAAERREEHGTRRDQPSLSARDGTHGRPGEVSLG